MHTPSHVVDNAHFVPFIYAFTKRLQGEQGSERAAKIFVDMMQLGIPPGIEHWTILASSCARLGDPDRAMMVLDYMEARRDSDTHTTSKEEDDDGIPSRSKAVAFPSPTLGTYTHILRAFVLGRRLHYALKFEERLKTTFEYIGGRPRTEDVLRLLRELEKSKGY